MANSQATVEYLYDVLNRVTKVNYVSKNKSVAYTYDEVGNRATMIDPDGGITRYEYDTANRLTKLTNPLQQVTSYQYDSRGRLIRKNYHNGTYAQYTYDQVNRLRSLVNKKSSGEVISSNTYDYGATFHRTKMTDANGGVTTYTYDALYQLTKAVYPDGSFQEFTYDAAGNRLVLREATGATNYSYDNANRLLTAGTTTYEWDKNGNMIGKTDQTGKTSYRYDSENRLSSVSFPDGATNAFTYYPDGRRLSKTDKSGQSTVFFYDGLNILTEANLSSATTARYTSDLEVDGWISIERTGITQFYHHDGLNSVTAMTNSSQSISASYQYDAFGIPFNLTTTDTYTFLYTGRELDSDTGLYNYRARLYQPEMGRFIQEDPLKFQDNTNLYIYTSSDPINYIDPRGGARVPANARASGGASSLMQSAHAFDRASRALGTAAAAAALVATKGKNAPAAIIAAGLGLLAAGASQLSGMLEDEANKQDQNPAPPTVTNSSGPSNDHGGESKVLDIIPSSFLKGDISDSILASSIQVQSSMNLKSIIPTQGPSGTAATSVIPSFPLGGGTNAVDAYAIDYVEPATAQNQASVFANKTIEGTYEQDYAVCNKFADYTIESVTPVQVPVAGATASPWFWYVSNTKDKILEETFIFSVFVNEANKTFTVDSQWLRDNFSVARSSYDYVFNFQIWAASSEEAYNLVRRTLDNLANVPGWKINYLNTREPASPVVLITAARVVGGQIELTVQNWLAQSRTVRFFGTSRNPSDRSNSVPFEFNRTLQPGFNTVQLPVGSIIDAVVQVQVDGFMDRAYVGTGFWFPFESPSNGSAVLTTPECANPTNLSPGDFILSGCAKVEGPVARNGLIGLGRTLNPNGRPIDISQNKAFTFFAKGDGKSYRAILETESVRMLGSTDFHQFVFTPPPEGRQYVIPLSRFVQQGWDPSKVIPFTGKDVKTVVFSSVGSPHSSASLAIEKTAFFNSTIIDQTTILPHTTNTAGPYTVSARITDDKSVPSASLLFSVDGGQSFTRMAMATDGDNYRATIPGQPLGTEVQYYIEATDGDGNMATDPVDVPYTTYRFQVSQRPFLLVDDYNDANPDNRLTGSSSVYGTGGTVQNSYDKNSLRLAYNVTADASYAGFITLLKNANLTSYNTLSFLVKGEAGGEKVKIGLKDTPGNEVKLLIGQYLQHGISTDWQKVTIPFNSFRGTIDWTKMGNLNVVFENGIGSGVGAIHLDEIRFENLSSVPIVIDNFNDSVGENGVGGSYYESMGGDATVQRGYDSANARGGIGAAYRINYNIARSGAWAAVGTDLRGVNASSTQFLSFYIKGANGGERPNIYLVHRVGTTDTQKHVDIEKYTPVTTSWQRVTIPLSDFTKQGIDLTRLSDFRVIFESEVMSGTIYLDDVQFGYPETPNCEYTISRSTQLFGTEPANGSVIVGGAAGCDWGAVSNVPWITITSGGNGNGNGTVSYSVAGNPEGPRVGTITLAGQMLTVLQAGNAVSVSGANYARTSLAQESIISVFGTGLTAGATSSAQKVPLPTLLGGTIVKVKDSSGIERLAPLFFVSPSQVNYQLPPGTAVGTATVTIMNGAGLISVENVQITTVNPGLFSADATGKGLAAAVVQRIKADGTEQYEQVAQIDSQGRLVALPIDMGPASDQVFLVLFGTGIKLRSALSAVTARISEKPAEVLYAGAQGGYVGLDQVNLRLSRDLIGSGTVEIKITVDGKIANTVTVSIR